MTHACTCWPFRQVTNHRQPVCAACTMQSDVLQELLPQRAHTEVCSFRMV